ncbi:hypothetical protein V7S43_015036 [Phytophthora oleae]|uniref:Uncharacterized protein n=1 Tax=Phytophthora oleae TaxID=2107226 RepID=A0ABD3F3X6_9STRA
MQPPPPLDKALPSRRPQRPGLSAPPYPVATKRIVPGAIGNGLLSKRVLSVENFRRERLERSRLPHTIPPPSKAIPMPLYPGETPQQYSYKFQQWLAKRKESFETLANDPKRERKLWLTFAFFREKPSAREQMGAPRAPKRSIDEEYEDFYQRSASQEIKRLRRDVDDRSASHSPTRHAEPRREYHSSIQRDRAPDEEVVYANHSHSLSTSRPNIIGGGHSEIPSSYQMPPRAPQRRSSSPSPHSSQEEADPRTRREILASYVVSADAYVREIKGPKKTRANGKLNKIPMPLFPGETVNDYDQDFGRWLHQRQTSVASLQSKPLKERVYRHQFARQRVMKRMTVPSSKYPHFPERSQFPEREANGAAQERHKTCDSFTRGEGDSGIRESSPAASRKPSSNDSRRDEADTGVTSHTTSSELAQLTVNKNAEPENEDTPKQDPKMMQEDEEVSNSSKSKRQMEQATSVPQAISSEANIAAESSSSKPLFNSDKLSHTNTPKSDTPTQEKLPNWALQLINHVEELEAKVMRLQHQVDACPCCRSGPACGYQAVTSPACSNEPPVHATASALQVSPLNSQTSSSNDIATPERNVSCNNAIPVLSNEGSEAMNVKINNKPEKKENDAARQPTCEEIHREATRNLAQAVRSREHEDPKQRKLTEDYDHLNEQISINETAIDDALDYIKANKDIDEARAMEQHSQIMELVVSINTEKEKRASALAALIVHIFADRQDMLKSLLENSSATTTNGANHGKLGAISSQIEEKDGVLETLEMHLNEQLNWVTGIPSCVSEADKVLRFKALRKISKKVAKEQAAKDRLGQEREEVFKRFVQGDEEIRKLVKKSLKSTEK